MATDIYNKLVRDHIPAIIRMQGDVPSVRPLPETEYRAALAAKLVEEAEECRQSGSAEELAEELADLAEVVRALLAAHGLAAEDIETLRAQKAAERGGFARRLMLEKAQRRAEDAPAPALRLEPAGAWMREQYPFLVESWAAADGKIIPWVAGPRGMDFDAWVTDVTEIATKYRDGLVPATLYGLVETAPDGYDTLLGFLDLRHTLNDSLALVGGHIGYGLHPAARGRGLAPAMLRLGLAEAGKLGIEKALVTCDKTNPASAATIRRCGGVLENEVTEADGNVALRFWVPTGPA